MTQRASRRTNHPKSDNAVVRTDHNAVVADILAFKAALATDFATLKADITSALTGDLLLSAPTLAIGTSAKPKIKFADLIFQIDGMRNRIAAGEVAFTATDHDIADPDDDPREAIYKVSAGAGASAPTITKGETAAADAAVAPETPAGHVVFGTVKIQHDGSAIFDASTNDLDAAHLTVTYTSATPFAASTPAAVAAVTPTGVGVSAG